MLVFLLNCLRFSKLLEILPSVWCNFSNLLKRKQSSKKTIKLDLHADTGALTPSIDWIKHYFSVAFSSYYISIAHFSPINARC